MQSKRLSGFGITMAFVLLAFGYTAGLAYAQIGDGVYTASTTGTGDWDTQGIWNCSTSGFNFTCYPDNSVGTGDKFTYSGSYQAYLDGSADVTLDDSPTVNSLVVKAGATLTDGATAETLTLGSGTTAATVTTYGRTATIGGSVDFSKSHIVVDGVATDPGSLTINSTGELNLSGTSSATVHGNMTNSGTVDLGASAALTVATVSGATVTTGVYTQSGSTSETEVGGTLISPTVNITGGELSGTGVIEGAVTQTGGTLEPGDGPGTLTITGSESISNSTYKEEIAGATAGSGYSVLDVSGGTTISAVDLSLDLLGGFTPVDGEVFDILNAQSIVGAFSDNSIPFDGGTFSVTYLTSGCAAGSACVDLTWNKSVLPAAEPSSLLLLGVVVLAGAFLLRRHPALAA